jgi:hypothetical protein
MADTQFAVPAAGNGIRTGTVWAAQTAVTIAAHPAVIRT